MISHTLETTLTLRVRVTFHHSPAERMTWDYPGCDEENEVLDVEVTDCDENRKEIEEAVSDHIAQERREHAMEMAESRVGGER